MKKPGNVKLSQCMIVKNEEKNIEKALSWGKDIVSEQIVVDTGSTDRTVELAEAMGATVYHFQWIDNFSAAKNFAISKATGNWIAFLDADEYFPPEDAANLMSLLRELDKTPYYIMLTSWMQLGADGSIFAGGVQTRIFKRVPGLLYQNRVHEELAYYGGDVVKYTVDASEELAIFHTGYTTQNSAEKQKGERNARLILMDLKEQPDNYNLMGYLADSYYSAKDEEQAKLWYKKAIALMPDQVDEYDVRSSVTFWKLMTIFFKYNDEKSLMETYEKAIALIPKESNFDYIAGKFYVGKKDFRKGAYHLERALDLLEKHGHINRGELLTGALQATWELLAMCHFQNEELDKCVKCCVLLLKTDTYIMSTLVMMLCAFKWDEKKGQLDTADVSMFLGNLYDMNSLRDRIFVLRASMKADYGNLTKIIRGICSPEEIECFDRSMNRTGG